MRRTLQPTQVAQVVQLIQDGPSMQAVARRFAVCQRSVQSLVALPGDEEAIGGQQPSSRTATSAFVEGGTGGALPEACKMTSSRPQMCMCLHKWLQNRLV
ncbi:hypothetical protein ILYODFUR_032208 [Ilyodon furcidens]|uniref:HTH psq-type domain-containing protein n=1 Tax=Ilyodon furcidens TaxID=33524 RepID=A0ABV0UA79_9TELE